MGSYKDAILPGLPSRGNKNKQNLINEVKDDEKSKVEIIVDEYIKMLKEDLALERRKETLDHLAELKDNYKNDTYAKIYEIYIKFINDESKKDLMQIRIFTIIEKAYKNQVKEEVQKENERICLENGHTWEEKWTKTNNGWEKKCLTCNKRKTSSIDPNKIIDDTKDIKGTQRKKRRF